MSITVIVIRCLKCGSFMEGNYDSVYRCSNKNCTGKIKIEIKDIGG